MKRLFPLLLLALTLAVVGAGCGDDGESTASSGDSSNASSTAPSGGTVRLGTFSRAIDYAPFFVARERGLFDAALKPLGKKVEYTEFDAAPATTEAFANDKVDAIFEAEPPAIIAKAGGVDVTVPAIGTALTQQILVQPDSSITDVSGLKGGKIAVLSGTSSHYALFKLLDDAGVDRGDVEVIDLAPPDAKAAFEAGKVDAWAVWPPFVAQEEIAGKGRVLPGGDAAINSIVVVNGKFAKDDPEATAAVVGAVEEAKTWIAANPDEAKQIVATALDVPLEVVDKSWDVHDWSATLDQAVTDDIQAKADFLADNDFVKERVDVGADLIKPISR